MASSPDDLLSFKEFTPVHGGSTARQGTAEISVNSPQKSSGGVDPLQDLINDMTISAKTLKEQEMPSNSEETKPPGYSFLTIEYYQQFFNVDTLMVVDRIASSMIPKRAPTNYLKSHIGLNPDLYGPFWIMVTLIFSIAISGNIASYLHHASVDFHWRYNFHLVSYAATAIFIYACFVPVALWGLFKWSVRPTTDDIESDSASYTPNLLALMCVYGYSLAIYIPVSILWVIQISFLQWLLVITAALLSGSVLIFVLTPALRNSNISLFLIAGILIAHFTLAAGFMLYFFHVPNGYGTVEHLATAAPVVLPKSNLTS
ncbi:unnamed protein product [Hermetia illucens]|uniref:Protein YIPF n=1 Tax=Hermetia illucens TaxID=343691 RepID=A0A7R8UTR0_HERIL|nr:protein YIPF1 isoform X1 [Hermetia illucens]CAD7086916.1 unnamed protein product [Hermetia illucens]